MSPKTLMAPIPAPEDRRRRFPGQVALRALLGPLLPAVLLATCGPRDAEPVPVGRAAEQAGQSSGEESGTAGACGDGVVLDDGSVETAYGFVPSATFGEYVQAVDAASFPSRDLAQVCICWLKTRSDPSATFEVVFYEDLGGQPAEQAYASIPASAEEIPRSVKEAGRFYEIDVSGVSLPAGRSYVGARWDPSQAAFLFVCTDTSAATERTDVYFREDRAPRWIQTTQAKDPIFQPHRAILVRARAEPARP